MDNKYCLKKDNKGFSLIELVIVVCIIGLFIGGSVTLLGVVPRSQVKGAAERIMSNMSRTRTEATSFFEASITLRVTNGQIFADISHRGQKDADATVVSEKVGDRGVDIYVYVKTRGTPIKLNEGNSVVINYNRATGGFRPSVVTAGESVNDIVTQIVVERNRFRSTISLSELSGRLTGGEVTRVSSSLTE